MEDATTPAYHDDPTIADEDELWRRIPPWHFVVDRNGGEVRPSSAAFDNDSDGAPMSVVLAEDAKGPEGVLAGHPGFALASFKARLARQCGQGITRDPLPEEPAHALVFGPKTKATRRRLARESVWVIPPPSM
jgi:hypothetical protein